MDVKPNEKDPDFTDEIIVTPEDQFPSETFSPDLRATNVLVLQIAPSRPLPIRKPRLVQIPDTSRIKSTDPVLEGEVLVHSRIIEKWNRALLSQLGPDIVVSNDTIPETVKIFSECWIDGQLWKTGALPIVNHTEPSIDQRAAIATAKKALHKIMADLGLSDSQKPNGSLTNQLLILTRKLLEDPSLAENDPDLVQNIDELVMRPLHAVDHPLVQTLPTAADIFLLPLLFFHVDTTNLVQQVKGLKYSGSTATFALAANAAHTRFRKHELGEGQIDLAIAPLILEETLPFLNHCVSQAKGAIRSTEIYDVWDNFCLALSAADLLDRCGLFYNLPEFQNLNPTLPPDYRAETWQATNQSKDEYQDYLNTLGAEYIRIMKEAFNGPFSSLFTIDLPPFARFANELRGHKELQEIALFNFANPGAKVSYREVLSVRYEPLENSSRDAVLEYYETHQRTTQFSRAARPQVRGLEAFWQRFIFAVTGQKSDESRLVQLPSAKKNWSELADLLIRECDYLPERDEDMARLSRAVDESSSQLTRGLLLHAVHWLNRPPLPLPEALKHYEAGKKLTAALERVSSSQEHTTWYERHGQTGHQLDRSHLLAFSKAVEEYGQACKRIERL